MVVKYFMKNLIYNSNNGYAGMEDGVALGAKELILVYVQVVLSIKE